MRTTTRQDTQLSDMILDWVANEVEPKELYGEDSLRSHIRDNFNPEDIFSESALSDWAFENGYRKFE